jgi:hypothetical protein
VWLNTKPNWLLVVEGFRHPPEMVPGPLPDLSGADSPMTSSSRCARNCFNSTRTSCRIQSKHRQSSSFQGAWQCFC